MMNVSSSSRRALQRLTKISNNVVDVLDADAEPNHLWCYTYLLLFFRRQLPVRGGCRMTCQRLGIAHIDHSLEQTQSIETFGDCFETAFHSNRQQRTAAAPHVSLCHRIQRVIGKSRVIDPLHHLVATQILGYFSRVLHVALHTQSECLHSLQQ